MQYKKNNYQKTKYLNKKKNKKKTKGNSGINKTVVYLIFSFMILYFIGSKYSSTAFYSSLGIFAVASLVFFTKGTAGNFSKLKLHEVDAMSGVDFEIFLRDYFTSQGYSVKMTPTSNDYGADLLLYRKGDSVAVQAKRYNGKVGNKAVQEVTGAIGYYNTKRGMVITNSYYTKNAVNLANANNIMLWDREDIKAKILR